MLELQELLDEWLVTTWANRPHDGLRHPLIPGKALSPNEMYAALVETAGYVPVPLAADDYIELLPVRWRAINAYGVKIAHRTYDCAAADPSSPTATSGFDDRAQDAADRNDDGYDDDDYEDEE
jgi:hypothetical protein